MVRGLLEFCQTDFLDPSKTPQVFFGFLRPVSVDPPQECRKIELSVLREAHRRLQQLTLARDLAPRS